MDIDIDLPPSFSPKKYFEGVLASIHDNDKITPHPCGFYFYKNIPIDPITKLCAIPYQYTEMLSYYKIDFLHLSLLDKIRSRDELKHYVNSEPDWSLLEEKSIVKKLFQIGNHFDTVIQIKPKSIIELADTIALTKPAKSHLLVLYVNDKENIRELLYKPSEHGFYIKKSHAVAYALNIVLQLNTLKGN